MNQLEFAPITVVDAQAVHAHTEANNLVTVSEIQAQRGDGADPSHNTWRIHPLYISSKIKRDDATGAIFKTVIVDVKCDAVKFHQTFETKLEIYDGSHDGCIAEIVSIAGTLSQEMTRGALEITFECEGKSVGHLSVPVIFADKGSNIEAVR